MVLFVYFTYINYIARLNINTFFLYLVFNLKPIYSHALNKIM